MRRYLWSVGLFSCIVTFAIGCTKPALRDKPPPDPLLTSKKPIEGRPHLGDARPVADDEYAPPPRPGDEETRPARAPGAHPAGQR